MFLRFKEIDCYFYFSIMRGRLEISFIIRSFLRPSAESAAKLETVTAGAASLYLMSFRHIFRSPYIFLN